MPNFPKQIKFVRKNVNREFSFTKIFLSPTWMGSPETHQHNHNKSVSDDDDFFFISQYKNKKKDIKFSFIEFFFGIFIHNFQFGTIFKNLEISIKIQEFPFSTSLPVQEFQIFVAHLSFFVVFGTIFPQSNIFLYFFKF